MREIQVSKIEEAVKEMCISVNYVLSEDMSCALEEAVGKEESPLGKQILEQLQENLVIAREDRIPICQDTGMAVVFLEIGQDVHLTGGGLEEAVQADRVIVVSDGEIALQGKPREVFTQVERMRELHLDVPHMTSLAEELRKEGMPLKEGIMTVEEMAEEVCRVLCPSN